MRMPSCPVVRSSLAMAGLLLPIMAGTAPLGSEAPVTGGGPRIEADMLLSARIEDPVLIGRLADQQLLDLDPARVEALVLLDLQGDGFGDGDLLRTEPGGASQILRPLSRELRETLAGWTFASHHEIHTTAGVRVEDLRALDQPTAAMLADLLGAARRHLGLSRFELALDVQDDGLLLRVWDYPGDSLYSRPGGAEGRRVMDVVQIMREDTTYVVDTILRDLLILESQVVDTLYLPQPPRP